jgi:hypothetical protein
MGRHFGATDVVAERGEEGIAQVRDLTAGDGTTWSSKRSATRRRSRRRSGTVEPGRGFDREIDLDGVPAGYGATDRREAQKVLVRPSLSRRRRSLRST